MKWSVRFTKPGEPAVWRLLAGDFDTEEEARAAVASAIGPEAEGWTLDAVVKGDQAEGMEGFPESAPPAEAPAERSRTRRRRS